MEFTLIYIYIWMFCYCRNSNAMRVVGFQTKIKDKMIVVDLKTTNEKDQSYWVTNLINTLARLIFF